MPHSVNIAVHIFFGTAALLAGIAALIAMKGGRLHRKGGIYFLYFLSFVVLTGLMGIFFFKVNIFLLVITMLSFYQGYSGYRVLQRKERGPSAGDNIVTLLTLLAAAYFLYYINQAGFVWHPIVIYSTLGWLALLAVFDLCRQFIAPVVYRKMWIYEHIVKMIGAYSAIVSAFSGTVLPVSFQPYSQVLPSVIGFLLIIAFCIVYNNSNIYKPAGIAEKEFSLPDYHN